MLILFFKNVKTHYAELLSCTYLGLDYLISLSSWWVKTHVAYSISTALVSMTAVKCDTAAMSVSITSTWSTIGNTTNSNSYTAISCIISIVSIAKNECFQHLHPSLTYVNAHERLVVLNLFHFLRN